MRKRRRLQPRSVWAGFLEDVVAINRHDDERDRRKRAAKSQPRWRRVLMWIWFMRILLPIRLLFWPIHVLVDDILGRRPLLRLDDLAAHLVILGLLHCMQLWCRVAAEH